MTIIRPNHTDFLPDKPKSNKPGRLVLDVEVQEPEHRWHSDVLQHRDSIVLGRRGGLHLPDEEWRISREHCVIERRDGGFWLRNLSINGTRHNQDMLNCDDPGRLLASEDILGIGPFRLRVKIFVFISIFDLPFNMDWLTKPTDP